MFIHCYLYQSFLKAHLYLIGYILSSWSIKIKTWLVYIELILNFMASTISHNQFRYCLYIVDRVIKYKQLIISSFHKKSVYHWCTMCPTRSMQFLYFLIFRLNIQSYSMGLKFHLDVKLWFLNFLKIYFSLTVLFKNKFFLQECTIIWDSYFFIQ